MKNGISKLMLVTLKLSKHVKSFVLMDDHSVIVYDRVDLVMYDMLWETVIESLSMEPLHALIDEMVL